MNLLNQKIPAYLYEKSNLTRLVLFTALFALIFINIYKPFSSEHWYAGVTGFMFFVFSSLVILTGVLVVVISRIIMYYYAKQHVITYLTYGVWILAEIFFMALFYTIYVVSLRENAEIMKTFQESITNTSLVLLLPYAIFILYFSWQEKEKQLQQIEENEPGGNSKYPIVLFHDEKGELRLSIQRSCLLYIESADNYVIIWYLNKNVITKFILRSTLKALEKQLSEVHILRCHRSFLVNFDLIKIIRREKDNILLGLGIENVPDIPISKTYSERVSQWLMSQAKGDPKAKS
ncbi:MAG: LytTR family transcriptional regulator [Dysgonamonadaceae bacterium]|jgi:DNA-binding LytR/AlgR family response regulator|nr:LytTR family transcriptional regulator [Dysgonamonadaceae bacterium]